MRFQSPFRQKNAGVALQKPQRKKTLIAVPTTGVLYPGMVNDLICLLTNSPHWMTFHTVDNCVIQDARNQAVKRMFDLGCDGVLFIDSDQSFPKNALDVLIETNKSIVGFPIVRKTPPYYPNIGKWDEAKGEYCTYENYPKNNLFKVSYIGLGFTYIRREVFEAIKAKFGDDVFFDFEWLVNDKYKKGERMIGEDVYFCRKAQEAGFDIWANPFVEIGHLGTFNYLPKIYDNYAKVLASKGAVK